MRKIATTSPPRVNRRKTFRLWHLVVAVFASALVFGAIRAIGREAGGTAIGGVSALILSTASVAITYGLVYLGKTLGGWATRSLMERSVRRGGVLGFCGWLVGLGLNVGFILVAIVVGPVATLALLIWLIARTGWF